MKYPIYIVSKGRYNNPITAKEFMKDGVEFYILVEPQEVEQYQKHIPRASILKLPFSNLGLGSYPARNYAFEHSIENGFKKHWLFDDNIRGFSKLVKGIRKKVDCSTALTKAEKLDDYYKNVDILGFNYDMFNIDKGNNSIKPFNYNVHVYSGMLLNNEAPYRWRLKYNEDVDLCLQVLHDKRCTILLNAYSIRKVSTVAKMKGGNQTDLYKGNAPEMKKLKSNVLYKAWPQYAERVYRFNRPHHYVNWKKHFKHSLIRAEK
jgi:hypothetical protein